MSLQRGSQQSRRRARAVVAASVFGVIGFVGGARGQTYYWDVNGANPGASDGTSADGTWSDSSANWTTDSTGASPTFGFPFAFAGLPVVFFAGSNATGVSTVTVGPFGARTAGFTVEEGTVALRGSSGQVNNGSSPALIMPGATLDTGGRFSSSSTGTLTIDGGTLRGTWPGSVQLTANGATFDGTGTISKPITMAPGVTSATLNKTGAGTWRVTATDISTAPFTTLNVNQGVYNTWADLGFGAADGTVNVADGATASTEQAFGFSSPATRSFVLGAGPTGATLVGSNWTIDSPISGPGRLSVGLDSGVPSNRLELAGVNTYAGSTTINSGTVLLSGGSAIPDQSAVMIKGSFTRVEIHGDETIGSLASTNTGVTLDFRPGVPFAPRTLTVGGDNTSTSFSGSISGSGVLTKVGTGTMTFESSGNFNFTALVVYEGTVDAKRSLSPASLTVGDGSGRTAVLSLPLQTFSTPAQLSVNGPAATVALGPNHFLSTFNGTLANGGRITGSGNARLSVNQALEVKSGSIGVIIGGPTSGGGGTLNKSTDGTVTLSGLNTYTGGTNVAAGTLRVKRLHENNPVNITGGTLQVMDSLPTLPDQPRGDDAFVSRPSSFAIANDAGPLGSRAYAGTLDLTNNDLIVDYTAATPNPAADVEDMVRGGYHGGDWLGTGITSSVATATAGSPRPYALGVADNATLPTPFGDGVTGPLFDGKPVDATTVLVRFTERVDLDLDGWMTAADKALFESNYAPGTPARWVTGDLDYDGLHTANDVAIFEEFYMEGVPEPVGLGALGVATLTLGRRRRPRQRQRSAPV